MNHDPSKEELVLKTKIKKEPNWIYHIDKNGNLLRGKMGATPKHSTELVAVLNIEREKGYLYFSVVRSEPNNISPSIISAVNTRKKYHIYSPPKKAK